MSEIKVGDYQKQDGTKVRGYKKKAPQSGPRRGVDPDAAVAAAFEADRADREALIAAELDRVTAERDRVAAEQDREFRALIKPRYDAENSEEQASLDWHTDKAVEWMTYVENSVLKLARHGVSASDIYDAVTKFDAEMRAEAGSGFDDEVLSLDRDGFRAVVDEQAMYYIETDPDRRDPVTRGELLSAMGYQADELLSDVEYNEIAVPLDPYVVEDLRSDMQHLEERAQKVFDTQRDKRLMLAVQSVWESDCDVDGWRTVLWSNDDQNTVRDIELSRILDFEEWMTNLLDNQKLSKDEMEVAERIIEEALEDNRDIAPADYLLELIEQGRISEY